MPWEERSIMSSRRELVLLAGQAGANKQALFRRYGIRPRIGYKWLGRYAAEGEAGLADRSTRPHSSPGRTPAAMEAKVIGLRLEHPCWGGRKLKRRLAELGERGVPSASTITAILHRHGLIDPEEGARHKAFRRFERPAPNELWQMDYKGHFPMAAGRCHPLTVLDDHSRFALAVAACADERAVTVQAVLTGVFRRYGLPERMLMDNGSPWGDGPDQPWTGFGRLAAAPGDCREPWPALPPADARQGRALSSHAQGRGDRLRRLAGSRPLPERLRGLAPRLQRRAAA